MFSKPPQFQLLLKYWGHLKNFYLYTTNSVGVDGKISLLTPQLLLRTILLQFLACLHFWALLHLWGHLHFWDSFYFWGRLLFWHHLHFWCYPHFLDHLHFLGCPHYCGWGSIEWVDTLKNSLKANYDRQREKATYKNYSLFSFVQPFYEWHWWGEKVKSIEMNDGGDCSHAPYLFAPLTR